MNPLRSRGYRVCDGSVELGEPNSETGVRERFCYVFTWTLAVASMGAVLPSAKQTWVSLRRSVLFLLGCACNPQIPPASLHQHSLTIKTTPKPKRVPFSFENSFRRGECHGWCWAGCAPLTGLSGLSDFWLVWSFLHRSTEGSSSPSMIAVHHWRGHCIRIAPLILRGPIHVIWQQKDNINV